MLQEMYCIREWYYVTAVILWCYYFVIKFRNALLKTLSWWMSLSNRNQSINLGCKSVNWFLYDRDLHHERVNIISVVLLLYVLCIWVLSYYITLFVAKNNRHYSNSWEAKWLLKEWHLYYVKFEKKTYVNNLRRKTLRSNDVAPGTLLGQQE